jgi:hypothetical protein
LTLLRRLNVSGTCALLLAARGDGNLLPIHALPDSIAPAVSSLKVTERVVKGEDGQPTVERTMDVRFWDKNAALQFLGRYHRLITTERVELAAKHQRGLPDVDAMADDDEVRSEIVRMSKEAPKRYEPQSLAVEV